MPVVDLQSINPTNGNGSGSGNGAPPNLNIPSFQNRIQSQLQNWRHNTPYITRAFCIVLCFGYCISFLWNTTEVFANIPANVMDQVEIYRIGTFVFFPQSMLSLILVLPWFSRLASSVESEIGSLRFGMLLIRHTVLIGCGVVIVCLMWVAANESSLVMNYSSIGFIPLTLTLQSMECEAHPEYPRPLTPFPAKIRNSNFVWVLLGVFTVLRGTLPIDLLCAIVLGKLEFRNSLLLFTPSITRMRELEAMANGSMASRGGYVSVTSTSLASALPEFQQRSGEEETSSSLGQFSQRVQHWLQGVSASSRGASPDEGSTGHVLGSSDSVRHPSSTDDRTRRALMRQAAEQRANV